MDRRLLSNARRATVSNWKLEGTTPTRTLRNVLGIGVIWSILWVALAMIAGTIVGVIDPGQIDPGEEPIVLAPMIGFVGFVCGVVFGALLASSERSHLIPDQPLIRIALCGSVVSAALPLVTGKGLPEMLVLVPLGAVSAMAAVALLRHRSAATP